MGCLVSSASAQISESNMMSVTIMSTMSTSLMELYWGCVQMAQKAKSEQTQLISAQVSDPSMLTMKLSMSRQEQYTSILSICILFDYLDLLLLNNLNKIDIVLYKCVIKTRVSLLFIRYFGRNSFLLRDLVFLGGLGLSLGLRVCGQDLCLLVLA